MGFILDLKRNKISFETNHIIPATHMRNLKLKRNPNSMKHHWYNH